VRLENSLWREIVLAFWAFVDLKPNHDGSLFFAITVERANSFFYTFSLPAKVINYEQPLSQLARELMHL
jgi:hypothetical protein